MSKAQKLFQTDFNLLSPNQVRFIVDLGKLGLSSSRNYRFNDCPATVTRHKDGHLSAGMEVGGRHQALDFKRPGRDWVPLSETDEGTYKDLRYVKDRLEQMARG